MRSLYTLASLCLGIALTGNSTAAAQEQVADAALVPERYSKCGKVALAGEPGTLQLNKCFNPSVGGYYGRLYLAALPPEFEVLTDEKFRESAEGRAFWASVRSLFVKKQKSGSVIATFQVHQPGEQAVTIAILELAKFNYDDGKSFKISKSGSYLNAYVGPIFYADANTTVTASIEYKYDKKVKTDITPYITGAMSALSGIGFLGKKVVIPSDAAAKVMSYEKALAEHFNSESTLVSNFSLSFDSAGGTNAFNRSLDFNRTIPSKGYLFAGVDRIPSVLVDPPAAGKPLQFTDGGYGIGATSFVLERKVQGKPLRDYFIGPMGEDFQKLYQQENAADFIAATAHLRSVVDSADLALVNADKVAALWAMIATNKLMKNPDVRANYVLQADEKYMQQLGLELPDIFHEWTASDKALLAAGAAGMASAQASVANAKSAYAQAEHAALRYAIVPLGADLEPAIESDQWSYRGEKVQAGGVFYGRIANLAGNAKDNTYDGQVSWSGGIPIMQGVGRYTFASGPIASYIGDFQGNYFHGFGRMTWQNGEYFLGTFANDKPNGFGVLFTATGRYFINYLDGKPDGASLFVGNDGTRKPGEWIAGAFVSVPGS
ncbi:hypothetical protein [Novosphingobium sp. KA1]|uniref:hypothetical protein n=1 Tax=Novosphingobium sp. (strain KA1) TaxID=164608 RepID=UPI001A8E1F0F|nr:hypothetical protein [Novosphingobium sp. KA1]QSR19728.1 hypothetical protein CA833_21530 [Novosphingobium sp. KA1]